MRCWRLLCIGLTGMGLLVLTACRSVQPMDEVIVLPDPIPAVYAATVDGNPPDNNRPFWNE